MMYPTLKSSLIYVSSLISCHPLKMYLPHKLLQSPYCQSCTSATLLHLDSSCSSSKTHLKCQLPGHTFPKKLNHPEVHFCGSKTLHIDKFTLLIICYNKCKLEPGMKNGSYHLLNCVAV